MHYWSTKGIAIRKHSLRLLYDLHALTPLDKQPLYATEHAHTSITVKQMPSKSSVYILALRHELLESTSQAK